MFKLKVVKTTRFSKTDAKAKICDTEDKGVKQYLKLANQMLKLKFVKQ